MLALRQIAARNEKWMICEYSGFCQGEISSWWRPGDKTWPVCTVEATVSSKTCTVWRVS